MTFEEALKFLEKNDNFILTGHESPDADAVGAEYALCRALFDAGKHATIINPDNPAARFQFIDQKKILHSLKEKNVQTLIRNPFFLIVLDTNDLNHLGGASELLIPRAKGLLIIDHHETHTAIPEAYIDSRASSTCELVYEMIKALKYEIALDMAEALYTGLVYDTGSFIYPKTSDRSFMAGLDLVRLGVTPYSIHTKMYESSTIESLLLQKMVLSSLELHVKNRIAIQTMDQKCIKKSGASYEDAESLINIPLQAKTVEVSVFFKENSDGELRCSFRSKGTVNVSRIAQNFGGGGHKTAAGFRCLESIEKTKKMVIDTLTAELKP